MMKIEEENMIELIDVGFDDLDKNFELLSDTIRSITQKLTL